MQPLQTFVREKAKKANTVKNISLAGETGWAGVGFDNFWAEHSIKGKYLYIRINLNQTVCFLFNLFMQLLCNSYLILFQDLYGQMQETKSWKFLGNLILRFGFSNFSDWCIAMSFAIYVLKISLSIFIVKKGANKQKQAHKAW